MSQPTTHPGPVDARAVASPVGAAAVAPPRPRTEPTADRPLQAPALPLADRRPRVQRRPSQRAAARALRRSAAPTTGRAWRRGELPGPAVARAGVPAPESVAGCTALALLFVPLALVALVPALVAGALAIGAVAAVLARRDVVVGRDFVAVRRLGRYHVATVDHLRHLELKPTQRGGVLCVHTDDGRCMRLRRAEVGRPELNRALRELWRVGKGTHDALVVELLGLPQEGTRLRHRYLADAVG